MLHTERQKRQYRSLIEDRARKPRYRGSVPSPDRVIECQNPICGDFIALSIQLSPDQDTIQNIRHQASGCAISIASADLMAEVLSDKPVIDARTIVQQFFQMLLSQTKLPDDIEKLNAFMNVSRYPARVKCATLCWHALDTLFDT